jgi:hypothetical protein
VENLKGFSLKKITMWIAEMLSRNSISSMMSAFLATALAYSLMAKVNVYLEDHYVEFINPGILVSTCMYTALFVPLHYIIEPTIQWLLNVEKPPREVK